MFQAGHKLLDSALSLLFVPFLCWLEDCRVARIASMAGPMGDVAFFACNVNYDCAMPMMLQRGPQMGWGKHLLKYNVMGVVPLIKLYTCLDFKH